MCFTYGALSTRRSKTGAMFCARVSDVQELRYDGELEILKSSLRESVGGLNQEKERITNLNVCSTGRALRIGRSKTKRRSVVRSVVIKAQVRRRGESSRKKLKSRIFKSKATRATKLYVRLLAVCLVLGDQRAATRSKNFRVKYEAGGW